MSYLLESIQNRRGERMVMGNRKNEKDFTRENAAGCRFLSVARLPAWRQMSWALSLPPYPGVPHLRGADYFGGCLSNKSANGKNAVLSHLDEAYALAQTNPALGMCSFWVGNKLVLLLTKPEDIYEFKVRYHKHMDRGVTFNEDVFPGPSLVLSNGKSALELRAIYKRLLYESAALEKLTKYMPEIAELYISRIDAAGPAHAWDPRHLFASLVTQYTRQHFMGVRPGDSLLTANLDECATWLLEVLSGPCSHSLNQLGIRDDPVLEEPFKTRAEWDTYAATKRAEFHQLFLDPFKDSILNAKECLFYQLLELHTKEMKGEGVPERGADVDFDEIFGDAYLIVIGALIGALSDAFPLIMESICKHSTVQTKLVDLLRNESDSEGDDESPAMAYLDAIIKETFRFNPAVIIIFLRGALSPFEFKSSCSATIPIRVGDCVMVSPYLSHRSKEAWGENVDEFDPERFLNMSPEAYVALSKGSYFPFGLGPRDCIGRRYAFTFWKIVIGKLFKRFNIRIVEKNEADEANLAADDYSKHLEKGGIGFTEAACKLLFDPV